MNLKKVVRMSDEDFGEMCAECRIKLERKYGVENVRTRSWTPESKYEILCPKCKQPVKVIEDVIFEKLSETPDICDYSGLKKSDCWCCDAICPDFMEKFKTNEELNVCRDKWRAATLKKQYNMTIEEADKKWAEAELKVKNMKGGAVDGK